VRRLTEGEDLREATVVEVGCGNGQFLRRVCERGGCQGVGYDPAYVGDEEVDGGRVRFVRDYYGARHAGAPADAVICRHVIEHVPRPLLLLGAVHDALAGSARAVTFFETPAVDWIFEHVVVQDFFYEHCSYFTADSLAFAFRRSGFAPASVARLFGEQYLWLEASYETAISGEAPRPSAGTIVASAQRFARLEAERSARLYDRLRDLRRQGPVAIWGAGAKGVTFLNHLDPDGALVDCVVDINPRKQGKFVPGTGHEIVSPDQLEARRVSSVVVMNPNYWRSRVAVLTEREAP
jgi:SAM-dependent methyltransferase